MKQFSTTPAGSGLHLITRLRPYLAALLLLLAAPLARAQAPAWQTAVAATGSSSCYATAIDATGNVYIVGDFQYMATFGTTTLIGYGATDMFIAKWSPATGSFVWALRAGGNGYDSVKGMAVSGNSIYLTGQFSSSILDCGPLNLPNTDSRGVTYDAFVAKLTDAGSSATFAWAQNYGGTSDDSGAAIAVQGNQVYVAGMLTGAGVRFGPTTVSSAGGADGFVAKLLDAGASASVAWVQPVGGSGSDVATALAVRGSELVVAGGFMSTTALFGTIALPNSNPNTFNVFIAKLADLGSSVAFGWAQQAGGSGDDRAAQVALSGSNVYVVGRFASPTATFGRSALTNLSMYGVGTQYHDKDGFVAKLTDTGATTDFAWAYSIGSPGDEVVNAVAVRGADVFIGGYFSGPTALGSISLTNASVQDLLVAKLTDTGGQAGFVWAQQASGISAGGATALALAGQQVYVGATVGTAANFSGIAVPGNTTLTACLASFTDLTLTATTPAGALAGTGLYPNPAHATATVQLPPMPGASTATLTLLDALGRVVRTATVPLPAAGLRHPLDLAGLPTGLYAVRVAAGASTATHRLLVE